MSASPRWLAATLLTAGGLLIAGCGGGSSASSSDQATLPGETGQQPPAGTVSGAGGGLHLNADPGGALRFNTKSLTANAGKVTLVMKNPSQLSHSIAITGNGVNAAGEVVGPGGTSTVSASLKPGTYTFYCTVPGHREAGMFGTLTVK
jgi:uncharacterized cupredoxin-like copper-binding protein